MKPTVIQANAEHLDLLVPLFDDYRMFYGCDTDPSGVRQFLTDRIANDESILFVAIVATPHAGLGFAQLFPSFSSVSMKRVWVLNDLFVAGAARRSGVGRMLMNAVSEFASSSGAVRVDLATAKDNIAAKNLYETVGYKVDAVFDHYKLTFG